MEHRYLGIDVGTGSARAGIFAADGTMVANASRDIQMWKEAGDIVEQSSNDIWRAICSAVRTTLKDGTVDPRTIRGIGFDATCSTVVVGAANTPLAVGPSDDETRDVIVWMDHRAAPQAERINAGDHDVLRYVGGRISPEMQTPKLMWLAENRPDTFAKAVHFFDLPDYLTWRATGDNGRSLCSLACKWTFLGHEHRFDPDYFRAIGLGVLADEGFTRIGSNVRDIGTPIGAGLTESAARDLGLMPGTPVGTSLIDAHAGGVGTLGGRLPDGSTADPLRQTALILGTSSCTMTPTQGAAFVPGVWGPYFGAMLPGTWLLEGGQSAFGAALDHLARLHPAAHEASAKATDRGQPVAGFLEDYALSIHGSPEAALAASARFDVVPEFLGNRAPDADPDATAIMMGMRLDEDLASLADLHVAGLCGLGYGLARILEAQAESGVKTNTLVASGGAGKSPLLRQILADATSHSVAVPASPEPVLLGASMLGGVASGDFDGVADCAARMASYSALDAPKKGAATAVHRRKRAVYDVLRNTERQLRALEVE